jgi:hypothetical protein
VRPALAAVLAAAAVAAAAPSATAAPAADGCTVRTGSKAAVVAAASKVDAVFAAKVQSVSPHSSPAGGSVATVHARVLLGLQGQPRKGGAATIELGPGKPALPKPASTYLFFADQDGGVFSADLCGGVVRLRKGLTDKLAATLKADLADSAGGVDVTLSEPSGGVRDLPALSRIAAPGAGVALFGLLGLLFVRRLGRERH